MADITRYTYHDADTRYVESFEREKTILQAILTDRAPLFKRIIARLIGFDGAYHRFTGKLTIEKCERGVHMERFEDRAIWELMYSERATLAQIQLKTDENARICGDAIDRCRHLDGTLSAMPPWVAKMLRIGSCPVGGLSTAPRIRRNAIGKSDADWLPK